MKLRQRVPRGFDDALYWTVCGEGVGLDSFGNAAFVRDSPVCEDMSPDMMQAYWIAGQSRVRRLIPLG